MKKEEVYKKIVEHIHNYECGSFNIVVEEIEKIMPFKQFFDKYISDEDCENENLFSYLSLKDKIGQEHTKKEFIDLINTLPDDVRIIADDEGGYFFGQSVKQKDEDVVRRIFNKLHYYYMNYIIEKK